jgi:hypothetical protein
MFAPKVARAQTKVAENPASKMSSRRSTSTGHRLGHDPVEQVLFLQRTIGNQATQRLLARQTSSPAGSVPVRGHEQKVTTATVRAQELSPRVTSWNLGKIPLFPPERTGRAQPLSVRSAQPGLMQPKLAIGDVNDPFEQEADRVAERVMRKPGGQCATCAAGAEERDEETAVHRASESSRSGGITVGADAAARVERAMRIGEPLPASVRAAMEARFGADFSFVRIHRDAEAAESAGAIGARAYTLGNHIAFASGQWIPGTDRGDRLIAHELVHTLQNGGAATVRASHLPLTDRQTEGEPVRLLMRQPFPGNGMVPPGDCSWADYITLRASVETAKAVVNMLGGCRMGDSCLFLATKIAAITAEIAARVVLATTCFRGGDAGHREQIDAKVNMLNRCYELFQRSNCSPEQIAAMAVVVERARAVIAVTAVAVALVAIAALVAAIIALVELIAAAAAVAAAEIALIATAAAAMIVLLVKIRGALGGGEPSEA